MTKNEKQDHLNKNTVPDPILKSDHRTLKDNPEGETICSPYFSNGCVNEDTDPSAPSQGDDKNEKY